MLVPTFILFDNSNFTVLIKFRKSQSPKPKFQTDCWVLEFGICLEFSAWNLGFTISVP